MTSVGQVRTIPRSRALRVFDGVWSYLMVSKVLPLCLRSVFVRKTHYPRPWWAKYLNNCSDQVRWMPIEIEEGNTLYDYPRIFRSSGSHTRQSHL